MLNQRLVQSEPLEKSNLENKWRVCGCWMIQIMLWIVFVLAVYLAIAKKNYIMFILFALIYLAYIFLEIKGPIYEMIKNQEEVCSIYDKLGFYFKSPATISLNSVSYHWYFQRNESGRGFKSGSKRRVISSRDSFSLPYYSCRDISGLFFLSSEDSDLKGKKFACLELSAEVNFADSISYSDYMEYKTKFWRKNRYLDKYMEYWEDRNFQRYKKFHLVNLDPNNKTPGMSLKALWVCIIFMVGEFYQLWAIKKCIRKKFTIRKIVSTRYDITKEQYDDQYKCMRPAIEYEGKTYNYKSNSTNYVNPTFHLIPPTEDEVKKANDLYRSKIPDYDLGTHKNGICVVHELTAFDGDYTTPPPEFSSAYGNVELDDSQLQKNRTNIDTMTEIPSLVNSIASNTEINKKENIDAPPMAEGTKKAESQNVLTSETSLGSPETREGLAIQSSQNQDNNLQEEPQLPSQKDELEPQENLEKNGLIENENTEGRNQAEIPVSSSSDDIESSNKENNEAANESKASPAQGQDSTIKIGF